MLCGVRGSAQGRVPVRGAEMFVLFRGDLFVAVFFRSGCARVCSCCVRRRTFFDVRLRMRWLYVLAQLFREGVVTSGFFRDGTDVFVPRVGARPWAGPRVLCGVCYRD